jgi:hypothetical protein
MDYVFPSQASGRACTIITEILSDREKSHSEPLTLTERIELAHVCALVGIGDEIGNLAKAVYRLSEKNINVVIQEH